MLWSKSVRLAKAIAVSAVLVSAGLLASCQVRPLYGSMGADNISETIAISEPVSRLEQKVRNELVFMLYGGEGEPANAVYQLQLHVTSTSASYFSAKPETAPKPGHVFVTAEYVLTKGGTTVASGHRSSEALYDVPYQEFAKIRALRDAEDRAGRELAELLKVDLVLALRKQ
jgi:LPS-assembly lipoprotein